MKPILVRWCLLALMLGLLLPFGVVTVQGLTMSNAPCTVTLNGQQQTGLCSGDFTPNLAPPPLGNDFYVSPSGSNSNPGTQLLPWKTIAYAATKVVAGSTVHVASGIYPESTITVSASGTATAPISFVSDTSLGAVVSDSSWHAFNVTGSYVTIKGFEVTMTAPDTASAIIETHGGHETIQGNYLHNLDYSSSSTCYGGAAVDVYAADTIVVTGNRIGQSGHINCANRQQGLHGIYIGGSNLTVSNNLVYDSGGYCIQLWPYANGAQVTNNDLDNCHWGGIILGDDGPSGTTNHVVVGNNIVRHSTHYGIRECCSGGTVGPDVQYLNNDVLESGDGNYLLPTMSGAVPQNGLSVDPQWVNWLPNGGGDYHLLAGSPAIDTGTPLGAPATDFDGNIRPQGAGYDIGAYER